MIYGIGTDIIEVKRVGNLISKKEKYLRRVFTSKEIKYCESFKNKIQNYAGRFATKEAFLKALGTGRSSGLKFNEIEIINDNLGKPEILLYGKTEEYFIKKKIKNIQMSLSHLKEYAIAVVILEK